MSTNQPYLTDAATVLSDFRNAYRSIPEEARKLVIETLREQASKIPAHHCTRPDCVLCSRG